MVLCGYSVKLNAFDLQRNFIMKTFLFVLAFTVLSVPVLAADKDMSCDEIAVEMQELAEIEAAAGNAEIGNRVTSTAGAAATQGAAIAGSSSIPLIGGIANIASSVARGNANIQRQRAAQAQKRTIRLETIAEMKGC